MEAKQKNKNETVKTTSPIRAIKMMTPEKRKRGNKHFKLTLATLTAIIFILLSVKPGFAWISGDLGIDQSWTDNLFLISEKEQDWITSPFVSVHFGPFAGWSPYYSLSSNLYANNPDINGIRQDIGFDYSKPIGNQNSRNSFYFGLQYEGTIHVEHTNYLDYHEIGTWFGFAIRPQKTLLVRPELNGAYRTFPNESDLSFVETGFSLSINKSYQTATTLRFVGRVDYKQFLQEVETETNTDTLDSQQASLSPASATDTTALPPQFAGQNSGSGNSGQGSGNSSSGNTSGSGNSDNSSANRGSSKAGSVGSVGNTDTVQAAQTYLSLRVAQSIAGRAGAYIQGSYRYNLLDPPRYVEGQLPALDREIFDDHYGYQGPGASFQVSALMPLGFSWKARGNYEMRQYEDRDALDEDGYLLDPSEDRLDHRIEAQTGFAYSHYFDLPFPALVRTGIDYGHVWNLSNDAYYDAEENRVLLTVAIGW